MGRITNIVGLRLGKSYTWKNSGIFVNKVDCVAKLMFVKHIANILNSGMLQDSRYLLAKTVINQEKDSLNLDIFFYAQDHYLFAMNFLREFKYIINKKKFIKKKVALVSFENLKVIVKRKFSLQRLNFFSKTRSVKKKYFYNRKKKQTFKFFFGLHKKKKVMCPRNKKRLVLLQKKNFKFFSFKKQKGLLCYNFLKKKKKSKNLFNKIVKVLLMSKKVHKRLLFGGVLNIFYTNCNFLNFKFDLKKIDNFLVNNFVSIKKSFSYDLREYFVNKLKLLFIFRNKKKFLKHFFFRKSCDVLLKDCIKKKVNFLSLSTDIKISYKKTYFNLLHMYIYKVKYVSKMLLLKRIVEPLKIKLGIATYKGLQRKQALLDLLYVEKAILNISKVYFLQEVKLNIYFVNNYNFTAELLVNYICIKLKQKFTLSQALRPLCKFLDKLIRKVYLFGYKIKLNGRFSRRQRASKIVFKGGSVPLATIDSSIDYASNFVSLKDGVGGIKLWLNFSNKTNISSIKITN
jgi:hypothetical protein